jgi:hypothetical protein
MVAEQLVKNVYSTTETSFRTHAMSGANAWQDFSAGLTENIC